MGLESADYINELVATNPGGTDPKSQGDDHLRTVKRAVIQSFPNIDAPVFATPTELNLLSGVTSIVPVATIAMWPVATPPDGWILCDGAPIDPGYTALIGLVGANAPDFRGYFPRGYDVAGTVDPDGAGRTLLDTQADEVGPHVHPVRSTSYAHSNIGTNVNMDGSGGNIDWNTEVNAGTETRPKNIAIHFIIKHD